MLAELSLRFTLYNNLTPHCTKRTGCLSATEYRICTVYVQFSLLLRRGYSPWNVPKLAMEVSEISGHFSALGQAEPAVSAGWPTYSRLWKSLLELEQIQLTEKEELLPSLGDTCADISFTCADISFKR